MESDTRPAPTYAYYSTNIALDQAKPPLKSKAAFHQLSMIENSAYRLATNIKNQKRANALKNITIHVIPFLQKTFRMHWKKKSVKNSPD